MAFKPLVTVGDYVLPEPSTYAANTATLVDSGRNVQGVVVGAVIRNDVAKVELSWRYLTTEQWARINQCFKSSFFNRVSFYDQTAGAWVSRNMYVSDRQAGMWWRDSETGNVKGWTDCKLSLVEV